MPRILTIALTALVTLTALNAAPNAAILEAGKNNYQNCSTCHGIDGKGMQAGNLTMAPPLTDSPFITGHHHELTAAVIFKGIHKDLKAKNPKFVQQMIALEGVLKDDQIASILTYIDHEFASGDTTITPKQVQNWRKKYKPIGKPWTRLDLDQMLLRAQSDPFISNLKYTLYHEKLGKLPDFSKRTPIASGEVKNNTMSLKVAGDKKDNFAIVWEGQLNVPKTDKFTFHLTSDDGSALIIDGETVIGNDGIHPPKTVKATEPLEAGIHSFRVLYFEAGGGQELYFHCESKSLGTINFTDQPLTKGKDKKAPDPILLKPHKPGEAIVHRTFLGGEQPRVIAVGYPGKVNLAWNADTMNTSLFWRGDFMDVAPHWNGRGSGSSIAGVDKVKTADGMPIQSLPSPETTWENFYTKKIQYERDKEVTTKEITYNDKHPDYQFKGYRLDENRFPTFLYAYQDLAVSDHFTTRNIEGVESIVRTINFEGTAAKNTYFRLATTGNLQATDSWYDIGGNMKIKIEGPTPEVRNKMLLIPITDKTTATIFYRWNTPLPETLAAE